MRYKIVPEPRDVDTLAAVHDALPLVPDSVEDCCTRVVDRTEIPSLDVARQWITFLQALELAEETPRGFRRVRETPEPDRLADAFERRVFGARELLSVLEDAGSVTVEEAVERMRTEIPAWERDRRADPEAEWRERTRNLLEWARLLGLVDRTDGAFVLAGSDW